MAGPDLEDGQREPHCLKAGELSLEDLEERLIEATMQQVGTTAAVVGAGVVELILKVEHRAAQLVTNPAQVDTVRSGVLATPKTCDAADRNASFES